MRICCVSLVSRRAWRLSQPEAAVLAAYGFSAKQDLLAQLLALNQQVAANIANGSPVTAPGVPKHYPDPQRLVTEDCIRPSS